MSWNIHTVNRRTSPQFAENEILKVLNQELDAVIIKDALTNDECSKITSGLSKVSPSFYTSMDGGVFFPLVFAAAEDFQANLVFTSYFDMTGCFRNLFPKLFQTDLEEKLRFIFGGSIFDVRPIPGIDNDGRILFPEKQGLPRHLDAQFLRVSKSHVKHLQTIIEYGSSASYFFCIEQPVDGGKLIFYSGSSEQEIHLNTGDGIVFCSNKIEHSVSSPNGYFNRISLGGYLGLNRMSNIVYYWS